MGCYQDKIFCQNCKKDVSCKVTPFMNFLLPILAKSRLVDYYTSQSLYWSINSGSICDCIKQHFVVEQLDGYVSILYLIYMYVWKCMHIDM